ncbi:AAA domain-containing protein [Paraliomyxa miuraensis]|uniref:AAA domain-containing protein n=1 Tax=Paraliomyxa miuraensis TaxID=376150 RepID=UPI0022517657|nr:AAA domain-containing protein [Paraliomyxa miuraensis]MCX4246305.1 AAA domain-containing protein [Paraliomyxa miuraensis]
MTAELHQERARRLVRLRDRFTAVNTRSRTIRLNRCTRSGAFDLGRLPRAGMEDVLARLHEVLGRSPDARIALADHQGRTPEQQAIADDLGVLARSAHADWLETGLRDLAVGWPLLEGRTNDGTWIRSPVLLHPLWLESTTEGRLQWVAELGGPPVLNASLAQTLQRLTGITLTLDELLADDDDQIFAVDDPTWLGIGACLGRLGLSLAPLPSLPALRPLSPRTDQERAQLDKGAFELQHHLVVGRFPPSGSSIIGDYDELLERVPSDEVLGRAAELLGADEPAPVDETVPALVGRPTEDAPPLVHMGARQHVALASDSSQDELLRWLESDAPGIVVQGPPGTGKSQLIANLVTAAIASGQRVLLCCEKRAALDVVAERLASVGLGEPLALVHDVAADRNLVCQGIASTIGAVSPGGSQPRGETTDASASPPSASQRAMTRLSLTQEAFVALTTRPSGRPPLARLLELELDDDGRPLPELVAVAEGVTPQEVEAKIPRLEALAHETEPLASPHPLAKRGDFGELDANARDELRTRLEAVRSPLARLAATRGGVLRARESSALQREIWEPADTMLALLAEPNGRELARFSLFWVWTGGHAAHGEWSEIMQVLEQALRQLHPVPYELILEPRSSLEAWIEQLGELGRLAQGPGWRRVFLPSYWRLRRLPGEILDRCPSLHRKDEVAPSTSAAPVNVERLCKEAIRWQELVARMPQDNPFLGFGFQGEIAEVADAIEELRVHHDRVRALHALRERLGARGEPYARLPDFEALGSVSDEPFVVAALADRERARCCFELEEQVRALHRCCDRLRTSSHGVYDGTLASALEGLVAQAVDGQPTPALERLDAILAAWSDAPEATRVDALLAREPGWVRRFLRGWRRHPSGEPAGHDARRAMRRAWRALTLAGRSRTVLEAPLVDDELLGLLAQDVADGRREAATRVMNAYRDRIAGRASASKASAKALRQLAAQAGKRRRRLTLRQLVEQYWDRGLADVRPVWLCSPDSVASMFPLRRDLFDLLIVDEASQCPVESALPVALRARRVLVAGDEQQMPPSRFFQASHGVEELEDDDGAVLGSQSLLELARVAFASTTLRWHYRSRHEALVAYSNRAFYGGRLITAPRAERIRSSDVEGLRFVRVDGLWQEQRNPIEAERVVDLVGTLLQRTVPGGGSPPSVGVVTFNLNQADLVLERLSARASVDPALRHALSRDRQRPAIEQLFVRNLENVQGDERDVIVFSPAYGPAEPGGPVHARFGPVGMDGGDKRLNVAITRARLGVWVVCSFDPDGLDVSGSRHVGPQLLRGYLRYVKAAAEGREADVAALLHEAAVLGDGAGWVAGSSSTPSPEPPLGVRVRDELAEALRERGLDVAVDHGLGVQRIDLAVRIHAEGGAEGGAETDWGLGIDCTQHLRIAEPITRDVYTRELWRRLGWTILRVTPGMWLQERDAVLERIERRVRGDR